MNRWLFLTALDRTPGRRTAGCSAKLPWTPLTSRYSCTWKQVRRTESKLSQLSFANNLDSFKHISSNSIESQRCSSHFHIKISVLIYNLVRFESGMFRNMFKTCFLLSGHLAVFFLLQNTYYWNWGHCHFSKMSFRGKLDFWWFTWRNIS